MYHDSGSTLNVVLTAEPEWNLHVWNSVQLSFIPERWARIVALVKKPIAIGEEHVRYRIVSKHVHPGSDIKDTLGHWISVGRSDHSAFRLDLQLFT